MDVIFVAILLVDFGGCSLFSGWFLSCLVPRDLAPPPSSSSCSSPADPLQLVHPANRCV